MEEFLSDTKKGAMLSVKASPGSSKDGLEVTPEGELKLKITAPAVDGKANKAVIAFLSKRLKLPKSGIEIAGGETSRRKRILFKGVPAEELRERLKGEI